MKLRQMDMKSRKLSAAGLVATGQSLLVIEENNDCENVQNQIIETSQIRTI